MVLPLVDVQPSLPPPAVVPAPQGSLSIMEDHYEAIAGELHAKNNDIVAVCARRRGQGKTIQMAEAHLRNTETQLVSEPQQRDLAMSGAKEVNAGIAEVFQQYERAHVEQTAERWSHDHCTS